MELIKKRIHYVREGKKIFDQFYVDEDYNVPEAKEDVRRIVDTGTELKIEEIRPVENYVRITGKLYFRILYLNVSSDPKPGVLEGKLPFEEMVYAENQEGEEFYVQNVRIEFTPSLIHSRKLSLRAMVELEVGREKLVDEETVTDAEGDVPLYKKMKKVQLLQLEVTKKDTYRIKEEITIPTEQRNISVPWTGIIGIAFLTGSGICLTTTILSFGKMYQLTRKNRKLKQGKYTLILTPDPVSPFSWGRYIFLSENDYRNHPNEILMHEKMHLRYNHSVDLIYMKRFFFCNGLILPYGY